MLVFVVAVASWAGTRSLVGASANIWTRAKVTQPGEVADRLQPVRALLDAQTSTRERLGHERQVSAGSLTLYMCLFQYAQRAHAWESHRGGFNDGQARVRLTEKAQHEQRARLRGLDRRNLQVNPSCLLRKDGLHVHVYSHDNVIVPLVTLTWAMTARCRSLARSLSHPR